LCSCGLRQCGGITACPMVVVDGLSVTSITSKHRFLMPLGLVRACVRVEHIDQYRAMLQTSVCPRVSWQQQLVLLISGNLRCRRRCRSSRFLPHRRPINRDVLTLVCIGDLLLVLPGEHLIPLILFPSFRFPVSMASSSSPHVMKQTFKLHHRLFAGSIIRTTLHGNPRSNHR
jgi:hypothetical protein